MILQLKKHLLCKPDDMLSVTRTYIKLSIEHPYIIPVLLRKEERKKQQNLYEVYSPASPR